MKTAKRPGMHGENLRNLPINVQLHNVPVVQYAVQTHVLTGGDAWAR